MNKIVFALLLLTNVTFGQSELPSNTTTQIDTTSWQGIRNRIKDQTFFIKINPTGENYYNRAKLKAELQDYNGAIEDLNHSAQLVPNTTVAVYYTRGGYKERINDLQGALEDFTTSIKLQPAFEWAWHDRALINIKLKKFDAAEADLKKALELKPNWSIPVFAQGLLYAEKKEYEKSTAYYVKSLALDPKNYMAYNNIGHNYFLLKRYDLAISNYNQAINLNLRYFNAYRNRADAKIAKKDFAGACQDLNIASGMGDLKAKKAYEENCK